MQTYKLSAKPGFNAVAGWNPAQNSYLAVVSSDGGEIDDDNLVLWIGKRRAECLSLDLLIASLAPYAEIDDAIVQAIRQDRYPRTPRLTLFPTPR